MQIDKETVLKMARLSRLQLSEEELEPLTGQLEHILGYVAKMNELDTEGVPPVSHALDLVNAFREDRAQASLPRAEGLANAPLKDDESFLVPRVI